MYNVSVLCDFRLIYITKNKYSIVHACSVAQSCPSLQLHGLQQTQVSLSITTSQSLLKLMSIELVMPCNHLILCRPLLLLPSIFPSVREMSQLFASAGQSIGVSASTSVLPVEGDFRSSIY